MVAEGRWELINGGWSENDEACPIFEDIVDNMMVGHQWIQKEFGVTPRVGWLIDSFGHSASNARLYADMGLEALFISRIATGDRDKRIKEKAMNYLWRPDTKHFGDQHELLVSYFTNTYCYPEGFAVDTIAEGEDDPFQPDKSRPKSYNAEVKATKLVNLVQWEADHRLENHIILPWGCDFSFSNAKMGYDQMDKIIEFTNKYNTKNITFMYSTPSAYIDAIRKENISYPVKYDDGFPYNDWSNDYWTGFFSSRPTKKKQTRDFGANMRASQKLFS